LPEIGAAPASGLQHHAELSRPVINTVRKRASR